jgi:hypothetical protein
MMGMIQIRRPVAFLIAFLLCGQIVFADANPTTTYAERVVNAYKLASAQYHSDSHNPEIVIKFARASFDLADFSSDDDERARVANEGIAAARQLVARDPRSVGGHYYLAMNLGQLARTKTLGALRIVNEMEREFKIVHDLDPKFDFAGASRNLGMLYHETPGWPTSIGSRKKAKQFLEEAYKLSPEYPENGLYLIETYLKWGDKKEAQRAFADLRNRWPGIKQTLSGDQYARDWPDWERRFSRLEAKLGDRAITQQ